MVFLEFLVFLDFLETSEVVGPGPNPREIDISFGAEGPLACARPDPTIGWTDVLPCVFVCVWGRYPPAAALLVRRLVVPVLNKLLQLPLHPLAGAWRVRPMYSGPAVTSPAGTLYHRLLLPTVR